MPGNCYCEEYQDYHSINAIKIIINTKETHNIEIIYLFYEDPNSHRLEVVNNVNHFINDNIVIIKNKSHNL